jgi:hypothetical protein
MHKIGYDVNVKTSYRMKKVKIIYNDKKMVLKTPYGRGHTLTRNVGEGVEVQPHHQPLVSAAWHYYAQWDKEILQAEPERFARSVFDARHTQSGEAIKQGFR